MQSLHRPGDAVVAMEVDDERPAEARRSDKRGAAMRASSGDSFDLDLDLDDDDNDNRPQKENQVPPLAETQVLPTEREDAGFVEKGGARKRQKQQQQQQQHSLEAPAPLPPPPATCSPRSSSPSPALSAEQRAALAAIEAGFNVFVSGAAGTGKSVLLRAAIELLRRKFDDTQGGEDERQQQPSSASSSSSVAVVAPTGVAAAAVGGSTVHAFAGCGLARSAADFDRMRRGFPAERWRCAKALVVDEVSMLSGEFLSELDAAARFARGEGRRSFGGIQLVLVGDFAQLAPVSSSSGSNPSFGHRGFAFQSPAWRAARLVPFVLTVPFRQSGQGVFLRLLAEIRVGDPSGRAMAELARRCGGSGNDQGRRGRGDDGPPVPPPSSSSSPAPAAASSSSSSARLYCLNKDVDLENAKRLAQLPGDQISFRASDELSVLPSLLARSDEASAARLRLAKCSFLQRDCLARGVVELKARALVMLLKNNSFSSSSSSRNDDDGITAERVFSPSAAAAPVPPSSSTSSAFTLVNGSMGTILGFATVRSLRRYARLGGGGGGVAGEGEKKRRGRGGFSGARRKKRPRGGAVAGEAAADDDDGDAPSSSDGGESDEDDEDASACRQLSSWQLPRASAASALLSLSLLPVNARKWLEANCRGGEYADGDDLALLPVVRFFPPPPSSSSQSSSPRQPRVEAVPPALFASDVPGAGAVARTQLPLRLSWALSVHKSQGLTLDRVTVSLRGAFAAGQVYVALSRARSLEGLSIELDGGEEDGGEGTGRRTTAVVRADPLVARFDAAVAAAAARHGNNNGGFRESVAALAAFKCRVFGARTSLAVDAVEVGGDGNGAKRKKKTKKKKAAAKDGADANAPPSVPPTSAAEVLSGIQCYSCKGWGHIVAACPQLAKRASGGKKEGRHKKKKKT